MLSSGLYSLDYAKMESSLSDLTALVLKTQATGDKAFADEFEAKYSKLNTSYQEDIRALGLDNIPTDLRFVFKQQ